MAQTVVVPEDKEIPLENNFSIEKETDTNFTNLYKNKIVYEIRPKQGIWYSPYIGVPLDEDSLVKPNMAPKVFGSYMSMGGDGILELTIRGKLIKFKMYYNSYQQPIRPDRGFLFVCDRLPSILFFGEQNSRKQYYIIFPSTF